jgi:hypothetical protein
VPSRQGSTCAARPRPDRAARSARSVEDRARPGETCVRKQGNYRRRIVRGCRLQRRCGGRVGPRAGGTDPGGLAGRANANEVAGTRAHRELLKMLGAVNDRFFENPELRDHFFGGATKRPTAAEQIRLRVIAENLADSAGDGPRPARNLDASRRARSRVRREDTRRQPGSSEVNRQHRIALVGSDRSHSRRRSARWSRAVEADS